MATGSGSTSGNPPVPTDSNKRRSKKRIRAFTADERASHRVIEKHRREALNESFLDLARLIPALAPARRLSKSLIVVESIQHLKAQRKMCLAAATEIQSILVENLELIAEVNSWREQYGTVGMGVRHVKPVNDALLALLNVHQETFGAFPGGFGDNGVGEDQDDELGGGLEMGALAEEQREMIPSHFHPQVTRTLSDVGLDLPGGPSVYPPTGIQPLLAEPKQLPELVGMPNSFIDANRMPVQQNGPLDQDLFSFFDDGSGVSLPSNTNIPPSNSVAGLNMHQDVYHDIVMGQPEMGYYLGPGNAPPNF